MKKAAVVACWRQRSNHVFYHGIEEGLRANGFEAHRRNIDMERPEFNDTDPGGEFDVAIYAYWGVFSDPVMLQRYRAASKRTALWYCDACVCHVIPPPGRDVPAWFRAVLDALFITNTSHLLDYRNLFESGRVYFLPEGCVSRPFVEVPEESDTNVLFVGTTKGAAEKDDRARLLQRLNLAWPIRFFPPDGRINPETCLAAIEMYSRCKAALSVNAYKGLCHCTSDRLWNILSGSGPALVHDFPGLKDLLDVGKECLVFDSVASYAESAGRLVEERNLREDIRRAGWQASQGRHSYRKRVADLLDIVDA